MDTLRTLAALGHQVIAIDLPGYGKTQAVLSQIDKFEKNVSNTELNTNYFRVLKND